MRNKAIRMGLIGVMVMLSACTDTTEVQDNPSEGSKVVIPSPVGQTINPDQTGGKPTPDSSEGAKVNPKEDASIRAVGTHPAGRLIVRPATRATVAPLGAASCYGQETDLDWNGEYEAIWESAAEGTSGKVLTFPADFEIIQRDDKPLEMRTFTWGDTDIFAYVPRYTDCHALETYLFGVSGGQAFPIPFEMEPNRSLPNLGQLPVRPFQVMDGELIMAGGYAAGMDFIEVYHFRYDAKKRSMVLQFTDQAKPNDVL